MSASVTPSRFLLLEQVSVLDVASDLNTSHHRSNYLALKIFPFVLFAQIALCALNCMTTKPNY